VTGSNHVDRRVLLVDPTASGVATAVEG